MNVGTPGFNGERLIEARMARGLTAVALSEMIGVSSQSISQYEKGKQSPRPEVLDAIASRLNMPLSYFLRESHASEDGPIFWRCRETASSVARQRAEIRLRWIKEILQYLSGFLDFPRLELPSLDMPPNFRDMNNEIIECGGSGFLDSGIS